MGANTAILTNRNVSCLSKAGGFSRQLLLNRYKESLAFAVIFFRDFQSFVLYVNFQREELLLHSHSLVRGGASLNCMQIFREKKLLLSSHSFVRKRTYSG